MTLQASLAVGAVLVGVGATLVQDLWNLFLKRAFGIPSLNLCLLGRWLCHMPAGTFRHPSISAAAPKPHECLIGGIAHYTIGITFASGLVFLTSGEWLARPTPQPALLVGVATLIFPYFLMQPALGLGIASSRAPSPARARLKSLMSHAAFGLGLYVSALPVGHLLRIHS
ncbi:DUF2938 domain-containing protein [bacterium]|nr:DUF2938 domain-containing protein [bacterium]